MTNARPVLAPSLRLSLAARADCCDANRRVSRRRGSNRISFPGRRFLGAFEQLHWVARHNR